MLRFSAEQQMERPQARGGDRQIAVKNGNDLPSLRSQSQLPMADFQRTNGKQCRQFVYCGCVRDFTSMGNGPPCSVCGRCCVDLICKSIESRSLTFLEVCSPRSEDGLVLSMEY